MQYDRPGIEAFVSKLVGIKAADLDWASSLGKKYGAKEELDGRGDAARHLALGWLAANAESPATAKKAIQAREYLDTDYIREVLGGKFAGKEMDLRNNELGMQIPAKTREEAERIIGQMIEGKEATFMTPQESYEMRGYAEGGAVKDYEYGFGPEASGIGRLLSPLMPFRREVEKPYEERVVESPEAGQVERVVTPGQYGDVEAAVPEALQGLASFKGLLRDPEARAAVMEALSSAPDALQGLVRRMGISGEAALAGEERVYDPKTGQVVGAEELMLSVPAMMSPATAAMTAGETGAVFGMMGSSNVSGRFKKAVDDAEKMFNEGRREDAIYRRTGVIRTTENKPGVFIPIHGEGGLKFDKFNQYVENDLVAETASGKEPSRKLGELIEFDNGFEAYPELKNKEVVFWPASTSPIFDLARGEKEGGAPVLYNATTDSFVVKTGVGGKPSFFGGPERHFSTAIQDYISQKEGFVRPAATDLSQALSPQGFRAKVKAREMLANEDIPSARLQYEAAQARYPYDIEQATRSPLGLQRESVFSSYIQEKPDLYQTEVLTAYGPKERRVYPVNMGALRGDLPNIEPPPVSFPSSIPDVVSSLKQEKGTGPQMLGLIKNAGIKQEDLERLDLPSFLDDSKKYTKQEILDHINSVDDDLSRPLSDNFVKGFHETAYTLNRAAPEGYTIEPARSPRTIAVTTTQDPEGMMASKSPGIPSYHKGLPEETVVHIRLNERTVYDGDKPVEALYVDEIQSDWHQAANEYANDLTILFDIAEAYGADREDFTDIKLNAFRSSMEEIRPEYNSLVAKSIEDPDKRQKFFDKLDDNVLNYRMGVPAIPDADPEELKDLKDKFKKGVVKDVKKTLKSQYNVGAPEIRDAIYSGGQISGTVPDAPLKDNWHEVGFRRALKEAVDSGLEYIAFTTDDIENRKYGGKKFKFYDNVLAPYVKKLAKRKQYNGELRRGGILLTPNDSEKEKAVMSVWLLKITPEMEKAYSSPEVKPYANYANGGGVAALVPRANAMFNTPVIRRGMGAFAPYTSRRA